MTQRYYSIAKDTLSHRSEMRDLIRAGNPTHLMITRLPTKHIHDTADPITDAHDAFLDLHSKLQDRLGPSPILFTHWPHTDDRPRIDAWLRITPQDTPPIKTILSLPTPFYLEAQTLQGTTHQLSAAYAFVLAESQAELSHIAPIESPAWHSTGWRI